MNLLKPSSSRPIIISMIIVMALGIGVIATSTYDPYPDHGGVDHTGSPSVEPFSYPFLDNETRSNVTSRYLQNMSREGPTGQRFAVQDAGFRKGTLVVRGQLAPQSVLPISETMQGISTEMINNHSRYPEADFFIAEVADCDGDVIARRMIDGDWIEYWQNSSSNVSRITNSSLHPPEYQGIEEFTNMPYNGTTPRDTWTCRDWERANPNLPAIGGI